MERDRILKQQKEAEELDKKAAQQVAISAVSDLLGLDDDDEVTGSLSNVKQENTSDTELQAALRAKIYDVNKQGFELAKRNFDINRGIEAYLKEVGTLLVDPDVVYALHNIQELGRAMRTKKNNKLIHRKILAWTIRTLTLMQPLETRVQGIYFHQKMFCHFHKLKLKLVKLLQRMMVQAYHYVRLQLEVKCFQEENVTHKKV